MFRTSKLILAGALVTFAGSSIASAQSAQDDILAGLLASASSPDAAADSQTDKASEELRAAITAKILEIATTSKRITNSNDAVTIQQLDELNRTAERAKTELELERLEVERMKTELESMLALYDAVQSLHEEQDPAQTPFEQQYMQREQVQQQAAAASEPSDRDVENDNLPRVIGIMGVSGNYEATLAMPDGSRASITKGSYLDAGFDVAEVGSRYVVLKGQATGVEYRLSPKGEPQPKPQDSMLGMGGPNPAADLNGMPIGIF